uniref:Uncharacterized protein n=1 Tax=Leersia perrieri TaxID=77586 RepID=A0A0D9Y0A3_9ORYZ
MKRGFTKDEMFLGQIHQVQGMILRLPGWNTVELLKAGRLFEDCNGASAGTACNMDDDGDSSGTDCIVEAFFRLCAILAFILTVMSLFMLLPLILLYVLGLYLSATLSLWRLIQRDYVGATTNGSTTNLTPALIVVYSLTVIQCVIVIFKIALATTEETIAIDTARRMRFDCQAFASVRGHIRETKIGCEKDPSFADERNLVTFGLELIESRSHDNFLSGVRIIGGILRRPLPEPGELRNIHQLEMPAMVLGAASADETASGRVPILQNCEAYKRDQKLPGLYERDWLLETYERDWLLENHELSWFQDMSLAIFKRWENPVESWKKSSDDKQNDGEEDGDDALTSCTELVLQGLVIFQKLAGDEGNCRMIYNTQDSVGIQAIGEKDQAPLACSIVKRSLQVMCNLVTAPGEVGKRLRAEVSNDKEAIRGLRRILECRTCDVELHKGAMQILTQLSLDGSSGMDSKSIGDFIKQLIGIFTVSRNDISVRKSAGEAMKMLCSKQESNGEAGSKLSCEISKNKATISSLQRVLECRTGNVELRKQAIQILTQLFLDVSSGMDADSKRNFIEKLIGLFVGGESGSSVRDVESGSSVRESIVEAMEMLCLERESDTLTLLRTNSNLDVDQRKQAIHILTRLSFDVSPGMDAESRRNFVENLINIFNSSNSDNSVQQSAGEAMEMLCLESEKDFPIILSIRMDQNIVGKLQEILLRANEKKGCRISAAKILKRLCSHYTKDGKCHLEDTQKEDMIRVMPKILNEILCYGPTEIPETDGENQNNVSCNHRHINGILKDFFLKLRKAEGSKDRSSLEPEVDEENPSNNIQNNGQGNYCSFQDQQEEVSKLLAALLSFSVTVCDKLIGRDESLVRLLTREPAPISKVTVNMKKTEVAQGDDTFSIPRKLKKMVDSNSQTTSDCLKIMKLTCKMLISMMDHNDHYGNEDLDSLMKSLEHATSEIMSNLEDIIILTNGNHGTESQVKSTLAYLVKKTRELVDKKKGMKAPESENASTSSAQES